MFSYPFVPWRSAFTFINAVPANAIININSKGAKAIYHRGAKITAGIIEAGDTATFIYNGSYYHLLTVDKGMGSNELPEVTTTDNGAFLRVVNGEWNKAYIENAEEVSF